MSSPLHLYTLKLPHTSCKITGKHIHFFHVKAADVPTADLPDQLNNLQLRSYRTQTLTLKKCLWLTLQQTNVTLHYKILPYGHSKVLRTNRKTSSWDLAPPSRRLQSYSIRTAHHSAVIRAALDSIHHLIHYLGLDSFSNIILVDKVSPRKGFFLVFTVQCQWVKQGCKRKHQSAKRNLLLVFNFNLHWICSRRKNWACAPFPSAEIKAFNQKKVVCGREKWRKKILF